MWDFYQGNQLEIKSNKTGTQPFRLKFWPQLEIKETPNFSQRSSHYEINWRYLLIILEILYFYNVDVNSYPPELLEEI